MTEVGTGVKGDVVRPNEEEEPLKKQRPRQRGGLKGRWSIRSRDVTKSRKKTYGLVRGMVCQNTGRSLVFLRKTEAKKDKGLGKGREHLKTFHQRERAVSRIIIPVGSEKLLSEKVGKEGLKSIGGGLVQDH